MRNRFTPNNPVNGAFPKALRRTIKYHLADLIGMRIRPLKLRLKLTNRCNARCFMCNVWEMQDNFVPSLPHEITLEQYQRLFEVNRDFLSKVRRVSLTGGEPTLRRDLVEIVQLVSESFPKAGVSLNSNGFSTKKTLAFVERIFGFRDQLTVMISLDGIGESHDATRGVKRVFPKVKATIDGLLELKRNGAKGLKVEINHVMTERNADQLLAVHKFAKERNIYFNPIYIIEGELYDNQGVDLTYSDELKSRLLVFVRELINRDNSLQLREVIDMLEDRPRDFDCWAGRIMFLLEDDGQLYPNGGCPKEFLLGNVKDFDFDLRRLLQSEQAQSVLKRAKTCRRCRLSCETMTTLRYPEALTGYWRTKEGAQFANT